MNYLLYVLAAYIVTFTLIGVMFVTSYRKYRKTKEKLDQNANSATTGT